MLFLNIKQVRLIILLIFSPFYQGYVIMRFQILGSTNNATNNTIHFNFDQLISQNDHGRRLSLFFSD